MSVICIGEALIDMICTDKGSSLSDGQHFLKKPGGAPTNVAAAIGALGGDVLLSAKVGDDPFGRQLISVMHDFHVDTKHVHLDSRSFTTFAFVSLMLDGERDFVFNRGADAELTESEVAAIDLAGANIVHFGSATAFLDGPLNAAYYSLKERAKKEGKIISFDPNYRHLLFGDKIPSFIKQSLLFLKEADFTKLSDEEAMLITETETLEEAKARLLDICPGVFAITLGKEGTLLGLSGKTYVIPSIPVNPVDTTGAGDAFVGAVLYQLDGLKIQDLDFSAWKKMIENANKAGARTCEYLGAMEAFKNLNNSILN
jgi:fructokinase